MRMIAGPNGSGKSTAIRRLLKPSWIGYYINPDDIQKVIDSEGCFDPASFGIKTSKEETLGYFQDSIFLKSVGLTEKARNLAFLNGKLYFDHITTDDSFGYFLSALADYIRRKLIKEGVSFTFETVMSSRDKVDILQYARNKGYRTYLYFVATEDPEINVERVRQRVQQEGHPVPEQKIRNRYVRSLDNLFAAILNADRSFIFDNSGRESIFIAEINDSPQFSGEKTLTFKVEKIPVWFYQSVIVKLNIGNSSLRNR